MKSYSQQSSVTKVLTGIQGFDEITGGGLPSGRTSLIMGGPGCGKTVFALQTLVNGAQKVKEAGLFVAFEESTRQIIANASTFGWDLPALEKKKLFFLDARLSPEVVKAGDFDLTGMLACSKRKAKRSKRSASSSTASTCCWAARRPGQGATRDLSHPRLAGENRVDRHHHAEGRTGGETTVTASCNSWWIASSCSGIRSSTDRRSVICASMKYRGSGFAGDEFPISLTSEGLQLTNRGPSELNYEVSDERIPTGLARLDNMLRGGYHRGSNVLISGAPGTAKSTLSGLFATAACERGERTLYVSFDEGANQIVRNLRSVGIDLAPHVASGLLNMYSTRTRGPNIEDQFADLRAKVREHNPRCWSLIPCRRCRPSSRTSPPPTRRSSFWTFSREKALRSSIPP